MESLVKFTLPVEHIFSQKKLIEAFVEINAKAVGIDEVHFLDFHSNLSKNISDLHSSIIKGVYTPEPIKKIEIDKPNSNEKRPIGLSSIKDKVVQRTLYKALNPYFDSVLSDKSYAYRPNKSVLKAINRTTQFLNEGYIHIYKTDIDNFFETIDHDILLELLSYYITDKRIIHLIALLLEIVSFKELELQEHTQGVYQGDILSPLLSNIYLDAMDKYLEKHQVAFVRYADDFVLLFKKEKELLKRIQKLKTYLSSLKLTVEEEKSYQTTLLKGFDFLGIHFEANTRTIVNERFQKQLSALHKLTKDGSGFATFVTNFNAKLEGFKNHTFKLVKNAPRQKELLQEHTIEALAHKVYLAKKSKKVTKKKEFRNFLYQLKLLYLFDDPKPVIELVIAKGYEQYLANKDYRDTSKLKKKTSSYTKKFATESTLHIQTKGMFLGVSKNKFTIKQYGRVQKTYPFERVKRIILEGKGFSLSSNVIKKAANYNIPIDFIDYKSLPYASLTTYNAATTQLIHKQALILNTSRQQELAYAFLKSKAKNQLNYLKYSNRYHKMLDEHIDKMEKLIPKLKAVQTISELMGVEGSISVVYWEGVRLILDAPFEKRITQGAKDIVNSTLNYAYAILYGTIQAALLKAGLSLNISFLHALDATKPTLTFDFIEQFRTYVVEKTVFGMINHDEPIKLDTNGMLTQKSRKLIAKNIYERLGSYVVWKKRSYKIETIIQTLAYELATAIKEEKKFKSFIGKY